MKACADKYVENFARVVDSILICLVGHIAGRKGLNVEYISAEYV